MTMEGSGRSMWWSRWTVIGIFAAVGAIFASDLGAEGAARPSWGDEIDDGDQMTHEVTKVKEYANQQGFEAELKVVSHAKDLEKYGPDIETLRVVVRVEKTTRLRVYISDSTKTRWEVPQSIIPRPKVDSPLKLYNNTPRVMAITYTKKPFGFAITRISNGDVLFNSTPPLPVTAKHHDNNLTTLFNGLVFKDQYLEISTQLPKENSTLFGLGETTRTEGLKLTKGRKYTLWTTDKEASFYNIDLYGAYPFYLDVRGTRAVTHGVLLLNSNGMEVTYSEANSLTYRVLGGVLDFYFFPGPTPLDVIDQYTQLVGRPAAQPYWSFGFHQCRWGYRNVTVDKEVVANFKKAKIPMDTMWNDIDYSDKYKDFTNDEVRFPLDKWRAFVDELHANGQHYVILVDPGIATAYNDYGTYLRGVKEDIFLKTQKGENYLGQVWPGPVYYPDFLNPKGVKWWTNEVQMFHDQLPFDGMWIDMNEVSNFCTGTYCKWNGTIVTDMAHITECYLHCEDSHTRYDHPAFHLNHVGTYEVLANKTAGMTVRHFDGTIEYNAHSLYGIAESAATKLALATVRKKRPFLLSRSTFVGSGMYGAHWTGDNSATYTDLAYSIVTVMNAGIVGIPMVGADICGFNGDVTEELCGRWIQVGAFHPFSRAHNNIANKGKEFYQWDRVTTQARGALEMRYKLLPYFYTLGYEAHTKGYPIVRPLFFTFLTDPNARDISYQFLIGKHVLVSPVLATNTSSVVAYFPKGTWYNLVDWSKIDSAGENITLYAPWDVINIHIYEGAIVPLQESALTSTAARKTPFTLVVAFAAGASFGRAHGYIFLDSGEDIVMELKANKSTLINFEATLHGKGGTLQLHAVHSEFALKEHWVVEHIVLLGGAKGFDLESLSLELNDETISDAKLSQDMSNLHIANLHLQLGKDYELKWGTH